MSLNEMLLVDEWSRRNRWASRHPGEKVVAALTALSLVAGAHTVWVPPLVAAIAGVAVVSARVSLGVVARVAAAPLALVCVCALPIAVTLDAGWMPLVEAAGVDRAVMAAARGGAAVLVTTALALTTPITDLAWLLVRLGVPRSSVDVLLGMHRFLFAFRQTVPTLSAAQMARRGFVGWRGSARSAGLVAAALWGRTMDRVAAVERGLVARGGLPLDRSALHGGPVELSPLVCMCVIGAGALVAALAWVGV